MTRIGAVFSPYQHAPEAFEPAVHAAEAAGVPELWIWEDCFRESAFASVGAALAWTKNLKIGLGIAPMPLRNVALTAMEIATVERIFPGRFFPGLGHGVQTWMGQAGVRADSPLTLMAEYFPALRALLAGDEVTVSGRYVNLDKVRLEYPPAVAPIIYGAGVGPKSLALSGKVAEGVILVGGQSIAEAAGQIAAVREGAGPDATTDIVAYVTAAFGPGSQELVSADFSEQGIADDRALWGSVADVAAGVARFAAAGADAVILTPAEGEPDFHGFLSAVGEVARLVAGK